MSYPYPQPPRLPGEFRMASGGFARMVVPFIVVLALFFVLTWTFGTAFTSSNAAGLAIGAASTLVMIGVLYRKFWRLKTGTVVRFSPYGVELADAMGFRIRLRWPDITNVGPVHTHMANPKSVGIDGGVQVAVGAMKSIGLIGWGERVVPRRIPGWMRAQLAAQPRNPTDGRPLVAIPLGGIDPRWQHGAMGAWVRMYRPDLLAPAPYPGPPRYQ